MKKEMIVCVKAEKFNKIAINSLVPSSSLQEEDMMLGQRESLENDPIFRQVLPINIFIFDGKVWAYRRTVKGSESRLHGATTICVGGHWDMDDIVSENSIVDWKHSIRVANDRELSEEVKIGSTIASSLPMEMAICSSLSEVDSVHLALITVHQLNGDDLHSNEDQLDEIGFVAPEHLLNDPQYELESWARIILENL